MSDDFANELRPPSRTNWLRMLLLVAIVGGGFAWLISGLQPPVPTKEESAEGDSLFLGPGKPAPEIRAEGWINGRAPEPEDLAGKMIVVEVWAFWCTPCLRAAPHTVEMYEKYRDKDVVFLGLTSHGEDKLPENHEFIRRAKFAWPCGYGANETLSKLYVTESMPIPALWVIDRAGKIAWNGHPMELTEEVMDELLNAQSAGVKAD